MSFDLGMLGPCSARSFADLLGVPPETLPAGIGGTATVPLVRELLGRGHRISVFTLASEVDREQVYEKGDLRISVGPYRTRGRARDLFAAERRHLGEAIRRHRPRLLHANWTYEFAMAAQASGIAHVITAHDAPLRVLRHNPSPYRFMRTVMAAAVIRKTEHLVAVSPYVEAHVRRFFRFGGRCEVVPNGVEEALFAPYERLAGGPAVFACCQNSWGRLKNVATALSAFRIVRRTLPAARLLTFGADYGPGEAAEIWARSRGLAAGVDFVGPLPQPELFQRLRQEVDIVVHPSREESHGLALVEPMALGIPVIGGIRSGAVPWTLGQGSAGRLADVESADDLAGAMLALATDRAEAWALGRRGLEAARRRFSIGAVASAYEDIYERALSESGSAGVNP